MGICKTLVVVAIDGLLFMSLGVVLVQWLLG